MSVATIETRNKALFHRWFNEVWNKGNYPIAYEVIASDFLVHGAGGQVVKQGPDGVVGLVKVWRDGFPDGEMTIDGLAAEGELVVALLTWRGTHLGDFYGAAPSGKKVEVTSIGIDRIVDGKIVAGWGEVDILGMMQQMGSLPLLPHTASVERQEQQYAWGEFSSSPVEPAPALDGAAEKALLLHFNQALYEGDSASGSYSIDETSYLQHTPSLGLGTLNFAAALKQMALLRNALPDLRFSPDLDLQVAEGDLVALRGTFTGTHTGSDLLGVPASGKQLDWSGIDVSRVSGNKIVERWLCDDMLRLAQQLGALPSA
jgi:predicted ester cyclase